MTHQDTYLDPSLTLRPATWADVDGVAKLAYDVAQMESDVSFVMSAEELANAWRDEGFLVERDVFVVETQAGRIVGSTEFYNEGGHCKLKADGCVHPEFRGLGIGTSLLEKMEERARIEMEFAEPDTRVVIQSMINARNDAGDPLLRAMGYTPHSLFLAHGN